MNPSDKARLLELAGKALYERLGTITDEMVERGARAIAERDYPGIQWGLLTPGGMKNMRERSRACLTAAISPKEPTI